MPSPSNQPRWPPEPVIDPQTKVEGEIRSKGRVRPPRIGLSNALIERNRLNRLSAGSSSNASSGHASSGSVSRGVIDNGTTGRTIESGLLRAHCSLESGKHKSSSR